MVTNQSAVLLWKTCCLTNATVEYGLNMSIAEKVSNSTPDITHRVTLTGLEEGKTYYYKVTSSDASSDIYNFKTAPADGEPFKMVVFGDNRPDTDTPAQPLQFSQIIDMVIAEAPHIVVMTGDYVYSITSDLASNEAKWLAFLNVTEHLAHYVPIYAAVGNHDT
jgi:phosphodiesterase/alkaline phosphatase D-like protein